MFYRGRVEVSGYEAQRNMRGLVHLNKVLVKADLAAVPLTEVIGAESWL